MDTHTGDKVVHITADERTAWNAAEKNAKDYADGLKTTIDTAYALADEAVKTELIGATDSVASSDNTISGAKKYADEKAAAAQTAAEATASGALASARTEITAEIDADVKALKDGDVKANADAIAIINSTDVTKEGSIAKALADAKSYADTAESDAVTTANAYTDSALTWGSF